MLYTIIRIVRCFDGTTTRYIERVQLECDLPFSVKSVLVFRDRGRGCLSLSPMAQDFFTKRFAHGSS